MKKIIFHTMLITYFTFLGCTLIANDIKRGEKLFNDPTLGNGTSGKTCTTCHENGQGISENFDRKEKYLLMGLEMESLQEVITACVEITLRGEGLEPDSEEMRLVIRYLQYLKRGGE